MSEYKTIAVIYGSDTSEWEVAVNSGVYTASRLDEKYDVYEIMARFGKWSLVAMRQSESMRVVFPEEARPQIDKTDFSVNVLGNKVTFDFVFVIQHGAPGESGQMQGYLEMLGIPHSTCSSFVSAIAFDKYACKSYLRTASCVKLAPDALVRKGDDVEAFAKKVASTLKFPVFVKPTGGGSSFGITKVAEPGDVAAAVRFAFSESPTVIVETAIKGRELTCAVYRDGACTKALPLIEIISENDYFDYDAKYNGLSREVCPAEVPDGLAATVQEASKEIYDLLGCKGVVRIDFISAEDGLYFLEMNTIPGMTNASLVPKMVKATGMDMTAFLSILIENA